MDADIPAWLYEDRFGVFLLVTVALGGGAAWLTGRAIAATWRPWWQVPLYVLVLAAAVRFIHFALFDGTFTASYYYLVDALVCLGFAALGFRVARARQMVTQYAWLFSPHGLLGWRRNDAMPRVGGRNSG